MKITRKFSLLCLLVFFLMGHYGILSTCIDSLFLTHYKGSELPYVWLLTAVVTILLNSLYNKFNHLYAVIYLLYLAFLVAIFSVVIFLFLYQMGYHSAVLVLQVWKDAYFVLLVEIFWSFATLVVCNNAAKKTFGIVMGLGTSATCAAYFCSSFFASRMGTVWTSWLAVPCLLFCCLISFYMLQTMPDQIVNKRTKLKKSQEMSFQVVWNSAYLMPLLGLMIVAKVCVTFIDFEFNMYLQNAFPDTDQRTIFNGETRAIISGMAIFLQFSFGTLLKILGFQAIFLSIPLFIAAAAFFYVA